MKQDRLGMVNFQGLQSWKIALNLKRPGMEWMQNLLRCKGEGEGEVMAMGAVAAGGGLDLWYWI